MQTGQAPGETYRHLMKSVDEIKDRQKAMCTGVTLDLDDQTKKLQQAYSKFNHKMRKAGKEDVLPPGMRRDAMPVVYYGLLQPPHASVLLPQVPSQRTHSAARRR